MRNSADSNEPPEKELSAADLTEIMDAFERSDWTDLVISADGDLLEISKSDQPLERAPEERPEPPEPGPREPRVSAAPEPVAAPEPRASAQVESGHQVLSPSVGIFWKAPQPGAPPFVSVGDRVEPEDTVCIIEVMKLMTHVRAEVAGTVTAVLVENSEAVEHGQPLFAIDPSA